MGSSTSSLLLLLLLLAFAGVAGAQEFPAPADTGEVLTGPQKVIGQVVRPGEKTMVPVPKVWVTLHRVGSDTAAPLDSVQADSQGTYRFDFRRTGDERAIYFVSATYGGIAYFTPPLVHSTVQGEEAEIAVFDTTSARVPLSVRGHHLIISAVDASSLRTITEVFEIANDSSVTRIAREGGEAVWSTTFPKGASRFEVSHGEIPAAAVRFANGGAHVYAPIAPGLKQIAFTYALPAAEFPLRFTLGSRTQVFEVLIEEEQGSVTGAKLEEVAPVSLESRSFRRFLGDDVPAQAQSVIDLPFEKSGRIDRRYVVALSATIGAAMLFALARALRQR